MSIVRAAPLPSIDGPDDQRLTSTAIPGGKDSWNARLEFAMLGLVVVLPILVPLV